MGGLNVYSQQRDAHQILQWSLTGDHGNKWHQARVPVVQDYPYKVNLAKLLSEIFCCLHCSILSYCAIVVHCWFAEVAVALKAFISSR